MITNVESQSNTESIFTPATLQTSLREQSGRKVLLMITDNTTSMVTVKRESPDVVSMRLHRMFLDSPNEIITILSNWARTGNCRSGNSSIRAYIDANEHKINGKEYQTRSTRIDVEGKYYNLAEIRDYLNERFFEHRSKAAITWGKQTRRRKTRSIRLGCYSPVKNLITMNRRLDRKDIPRYMIESVIYHEMLHEIIGIGQKADGRRDIHGKTFKMMEEAYPEHQRALAFARKKWGF